MSTLSKLGSTNTYDSRPILLGLILINASHAIASSEGVILLSLFSIFTVAFNRKNFYQNLNVFLVTVFVLLVFGMFAWLTTREIDFTSLALDLIRWISLTSFSLTIFSSLSVLDLVTALRWYKLPLGIALSLGIAMRFLPAILDDSRRIYKLNERRLKLDDTSSYFISRMRLFWNLISVLLIDVIRKIDNLVLSVTVQDLENRLNSYVFNEFRIQDYFLFLVLILIFLACFFL